MLNITASGTYPQSEVTSKMEREEKYMKEIEHNLTDCSDKEKIKILMQKLHYWVKSARNWERLYREGRK